MNIRNLRLEASYDQLFRPYVMFRRSRNEDAARYFGHRWYLMVHILWWEVYLLELC